MNSLPVLVLSLSCVLVAILPYAAQAGPIEHLDDIANVQIVLESVGGLGGGGVRVDLRGDGEGDYFVYPRADSSRAKPITRHVEFPPDELLALLSRFFDARFFDMPDRIVNRNSLQLHEDGTIEVQRQGVIDAGSCTITVSFGEYRKSVEFSRAAGIAPAWLNALAEIVELFAERRIKEGADIGGD